MEEKNKNRFDIIDVENLYSQWHPDPIIFLKKIDQECSLDLLAKTEITYLNNSEYKNILNFTNSPECEDILSRVEKKQIKKNFLKYWRIEINYIQEYLIGDIQLKNSII